MVMLGLGVREAREGRLGGGVPHDGWGGLESDARLAARSAISHGLSAPLTLNLTVSIIPLPAEVAR